MARDNNRDNNIVRSQYCRCDLSLGQEAGRRVGRSDARGGVMNPTFLILRATRQGDRTVKIQYKSTLPTAQLLILTGAAIIVRRLSIARTRLTAEYFTASRNDGEPPELSHKNESCAIGDVPSSSREPRRPPIKPTSSRFSSELSPELVGLYDKQQFW